MMLVIADYKGICPPLHTILPLICLSNDALTLTKAHGFPQKWPLWMLWSRGGAPTPSAACLRTSWRSPTLQAAEESNGKSCPCASRPPPRDWRTGDRQNGLAAGVAHCR